MDLVDIEKLLDDFELNEDQRDMVMQRQTEQSSIVRVPSTAPPTNDEVQPYSLAAIIATATTTTTATATAPEPESELIKGRQIFIPEDPGGGGGGDSGIIIDHRETIPQIIRDFNYNNNNGGGGEDNQQNSDLNFPQQTQHSLSTSTSSTSSSSASPSPSSATTNQRNSNFVNVSNVFSSLHEYVNARIETAAETAETATKKTTKSTKIDDIDIEQNHHSIDSFHNQQQSQSQSQSQQQQFNSISSQSSSLSPTIQTASQSASSQSAPQSQSSSDPYSNSLSSSSSSSSILLSSFPHVTDPQLNKPLSTFIELSEETRTDFLEKNPKSSSLDNNRKLRKLTIKSKRNRCNLQMSTQNPTSTFVSTPEIVSTLDQNQLENLNNHVILKSECDKTLINNQNLQQYGIVNQSYSSSLDEDEEDDDDDVDDEEDNDLESSSGSSVSLSLSSPTAAAAAAADAEAEAATAATTSAAAESTPTSKIIESSDSQNITKTNLENSNLFIATKRKINKIPTIKCHHSQIDNCESKVPQKIPIKLIIKNHRRRERRRQQQQQQQQLQQQRRQQSSQRKQLRRKIVPAVDSLIPLMEAAAAPKTTTTTTMTTENISIGNLNATKNNQSDDDDDDEKTTQKLNGNNQIKEIDIKNQLKEFIEQKPETASNELNAEHGKQTVIGFTSIATATGTTTMDDISDTELESYLQELELETATVAATTAASATATEMSIDGGPLTNINEQWNVEHRRPIGDGQEEQMIMTSTTNNANDADDVDLDDDELNLTNLTTTTTTTTSSSSMSISVTEDPAELDDDDDEHREREFSLDLKLSTTTLSTSDCEHPQTSQNTHNDVKSAEVEIPNRHIDLMEIEKYHQNDKMAMANGNDSNSNNEIVKIPEITGMIGKTTTDEILENVVGMTASATTMSGMEATTMATMAKDDEEKVILKETDTSSNPIQMKQADADDSETTPAAVAAVAVAGTTTSSSSSSSSLSLSIDSQPSESESTTAPLDTDCISSDTNENNIDSTGASATSATIPSPSPSQSSPSQHPIPLSSILMRPTNAHQQLGKIQPYWIPDNVTNFCMQCNLKFSLIKRRHHCRACGQVLCSTCCSLKARLPYLDDCEARVCIQCDIILHDRDSTDDALLMLDGDGGGSGSGSGSGNIGSGSALGNDGNDSLNNLIISGGGSNLNCALDSFGNPIREENDRVRAVNSKFITPNPKNPMEYCSKIPPSQQQQQQQSSAAASASSSSSSSGQSAIKSPISVMVPVGVLKKRTPATISATTSSSSSSSGSSSSSAAAAVSGLGSSGAGAGAVAPPIRKNVMFSDGIRPGCDLTDLDTNWDRIVSTSTSTSTSVSTSNKIGTASGSGMTINGNSSSTTTTTTTKIATASASTVSASIPSSSTPSTISRVFKQSVGGVTVNNGNGGGAGSINTNTNKIKLPVIDSTTKSFIPKGGLTNFQLPPIYQQHSPIKYTFVDIENDEQLLSRLTDETLTFAIQRNFYVLVRIVKLTCCINKTVINFTTQGLHHVGQDEIVILLDMQQPTTSQQQTLQSENNDDGVPLTTTALPNAPIFKRLPKEIFLHLNDIYLEADKGNSIGELGFSLVGSNSNGGIGSITGNHSTGNSTGINGGGGQGQGQEFLDSKEHGGFLYIRSTFQCLQNIIVPESPFLIGLLLHRWEIPWAKIFPLRLMLRLGALYRYYPCPHVSVLARNSVYAEIAQTIINFLADFRTYSYTVPSIHGMYIHMESRCTTVLIPKNRYDQIMKAINDSSDHILALGGNFSKKADGHLVCIQNTEAGCPETHSYSTQAINIHGQPRKVTGASFILLNGALKTASGLSGKCSIVEDGLMVQILPAKMITIRKSLKAMENVEIVCGPSDAVDPEQTETVNFKWIENDTDFNVGVISPIDKKPMDGIPCIRVHHGMDYSNSNHLIRWTEVFIIKADDESVHGRDPIDIPKLSEQIAKSTSIALVLFLDLLAASGFRKIGLRTTFDQDNVCYEAGSQFNKLAPLYMNALDNELIPTLHSQATNLNLDTPITIELIFHILNE